MNETLKIEGLYVTVSINDSITVLFFYAECNYAVLSAVILNVLAPFSMLVTPDKPLKSCQDQGPDSHHFIFFVACEWTQ